jgi:spermidine synthase
MKRIFLMLIILQLAIVSSQALAGHIPDTETLYEKNSLYQFIMVDEDLARGERYILVNTKKDRPQGGILIDDPDKLLFEYTRMAFTSLVYLDREPGDVLFVGLGAGVMPRYFNKHYPDANVDAVEIDPEMFEVAKKYFYFQEKSNMKVHILDGRMFLKRTANRYDMIFLDAYRGEHIPFHLTTVEFLREVKRKLRDGGVVISNILSKSNNKYFWSMIKTYKEEFESLYVFKGEDSGNFIFVAAVNDIQMEKDVFLTRAEKIRSGRGMDIDLQHLPWDYEGLQRLPWQYGGRGVGWDSKLLTDDFAPVNLYKHMELDR